MRLSRLWLTDFRNYHDADLLLAPDGLTVVLGDNGQGKTNLLEAVGWLATLGSFRGAPPEAMVRFGTEQAVIRGEGERDGRRLLIEGEINGRGRQRVLINKQPLRRARDLLGHLRVSVFSPDDLVLLKGGPSHRRTYLDELLVGSHARWEPVCADLDRILRQRATLLKQAGGRLGRMDADALATLDVWDAKFVATGESLATARISLIDQLAPWVEGAYAALAGRPVAIGLSYAAPWRAEGLAAALAAARELDVRRGLTSVGPHRDEMVVTIDGLPARTHASQGEQRTLALALRLGGHHLMTDLTGEAPLLLLDDVFSELDEHRRTGLVRSLPPGQAVLTTVGPIPAEVAVAEVVRIEAGRVVRAA